jgi:hypothetical protein
MQLELFTSVALRSPPVSATAVELGIFACKLADRFACNVWQLKTGGSGRKTQCDELSAAWNLSRESLALHVYTFPPLHPSLSFSKAFA